MAFRLVQIKIEFSHLSLSLSSEAVMSKQLVDLPHCVDSWFQLVPTGYDIQLEVVPSAPFVSISPWTIDVRDTRWAKGS
jgi:hypothetical protein